VRYLIIMLLFISNTVTANCFIVTNLMTVWEANLDALGMPVGAIKEKEFQITIDDKGASVSPGSWTCIRITKKIIECGEDLRLAVLDETEIEQLKKSGVISPDADTGNNILTVTKGTVKQSWYLMYKSNEVFLESFEGKKTKKYYGQIKGTC